jgi:type II restriction/modification system DNA methylase subunit YeeA
METAKLKRFAQFARRTLRDQVTAKLKLVLADGSAARRENAAAVQALEEQIAMHGQDQVVERVAYTWFNRFCALRFMDVNRYNSVGVLSPERGQFQPEILAEAKMGHINNELVPERTRQQVAALLDGKSPSREPQAEAYRLLVVAVCNFWNVAMPFLFARIADYTELLMPDDLLSGISVVTLTREAMTPDVCQDVEVIGWLYQFYISEKKDQVFEGMKKGKKIAPENIPAATQLFTPHWIVRYLVENSLGRLWLLNRPQSKLVEKMDYYIKPEQPEADFLRIDSPEEIKICDPACGSGHMLVYAFDLLYTIYEDEGYPATEIPEKILTHNLFGIEIDERAGELAAFALAMKARSRNIRFLRKPVQPKICILENVHFEDGELKQYMDFVGRDIFTDSLRSTLRQFEEADNFGSLIRPDLTEVEKVRRVLSEKDTSENLYLATTHKKALRVLEQAEFLRPKYHVVVANPPYMGGKGMNGRLGTWLKEEFPDVKSDLFSAFVVRNTELGLPQAQLGFMTPFVWMFISSYEDLRSFLINQKTITSLIQLEYSGFDGATVPICTFTMENSHQPTFEGAYIRLSDFRGSDVQGPKTLEAVKNPACGWFYRATAASFKKIPGSPIAYWVGEKVLRAFETGTSIDSRCSTRKGMATGLNAEFVRSWTEVSIERIGFSLSRSTAAQSGCKWFPYANGGEFRKWYGNYDDVVNWENDGERLQTEEHESGRIRAVNLNLEYIFTKGLSWTSITSGHFSIRYLPPGFLFSSASNALFTQDDLRVYLGLLNSKVHSFLGKALNPTLNANPGDIGKIPLPASSFECTDKVDDIVRIHKVDWDSFEGSWNFNGMALLSADFHAPTIESAYRRLRVNWTKLTTQARQIEEAINHTLIEAYGLRGAISAEVPLNEVTLTCNPAYRYKGVKSEEELESLLLADTVTELISYAVACMFGRYALEKSGLILANQGDTIEQYFSQIPNPSFRPDKDNVIPILNKDWFPDDISGRFKKFLRVTFGDEHFEENLKFIEQSIGKDIRTYFAKDFYNDHVKRYKKRPIYWMFSSPKGSFNALIYMHRYRPDTVSVVLNDYLIEFRTKLISSLDYEKRKEASADTSKAEKTKALKEIEILKKTIDELATWERDVLYDLAGQRIEIDLDNGVKKNYAMFGAALKKIPGLDVSEE